MIYPKRKFEVRFFYDSITRFTWSSTDIISSQETTEVVRLFEFEKRNLYSIYFNDVRIEYVGKG
ncbi:MULTISPECIES: hypothetical protein [unclassified Gemella]|uniref:hypothetical protein n=1 Tax=unclassified Gemella TaxID=2624949 RepID=UPI001073B1D0|nr:MULTISPECIES: hypothetical protein [unclassified Gemella]MBF0710670.1 hypothetical protein [Gemella sp. GL1.1]MBF0746351.1 hypothetical protein [Gemella sp. 19428wG2_WT2a]NYS28014.1 hypothetical protein [Gemella sp. GL1]TFU60134.1 hypothetical protein E4T67_01475 [Gemella sp. WT2a]